MTQSKNQIDKAGKQLAKGSFKTVEDIANSEKYFDDYRRDHLKPLSSTTLEIQQWLSSYGTKFFIAQRLKRKPQILRKLNRLKVRLTQLQDIGGSRIIVESNYDVDRLIDFLQRKVDEQSHISLVRKVDYREKGRDDSGYRAVHLILERESVKVELQIRSRIQHYWAELIERTSVVYGHYLKELDGNPIIIAYFKSLSDLFYEIESGRQPSSQHKIKVENLRLHAEAIIEQSDTSKVFNSHVNEGIVKTLIDKEKRIGGAGFNNWIFVFNWNLGSFISWDIVEFDADAAIKKYVEYEKQFPADEGYEVVLVGSSEVATVRETHSHYFGLDANRQALETLNESIVGFSSKMDIDVGGRQILVRMDRRHCWGSKTIAVETLKNHFCQDVLTFESSLETLIEKALIHQPSGTRGVALNIKKKQEIEVYLS